MKKPIHFAPSDEPGRFEARLGQLAIECSVKAHVGFRIDVYGTEVWVPCESKGCPDDLDPDDFDACIDRCPYAKIEEAPMSTSFLWGTEDETCASIAREVRRMLRTNRNPSGHFADLPVEEARQFAARDWEIGGDIYRWTP